MMINSIESGNNKIVVTDKEECYEQNYQVSCIACKSQFVATISVSPSRENFLSIWEIVGNPTNLRFSDVSSAKFSRCIFSTRGKFTNVEISTKSNEEDLFVIIVMGCARNYLMKLELSSNFVLLDNSEIELEESSTNISISALGDRIASLEGNDIVIRSDSLKRIRKFKCPNNELTDFDFLTIDGGYLVACFENGLIMGWNVKTSGPIFEFDSLSKAGGTRHIHNNVSLCRLVVLHQESTARRENNDSVELGKTRIIVAGRSSMLWMIEILPRLTTSKSSEDNRPDFICREVQSLDLQKTLRYIVSSSSLSSACPATSNVESKSKVTDRFESGVGALSLPILAKEGHVLPLCLHYIAPNANANTNASKNLSGKLMVCTPAVTLAVNLQTFTVDSTVTLGIKEDEIKNEEMSTVAEEKKRNNSQANGLLLLNTFGTTLSLVKMSDFSVAKSSSNRYQGDYVRPPGGSRRRLSLEEDEQPGGKLIESHQLILVAVPSFGTDPICLLISLTTTTTVTSSVARTVTKGGSGRHEISVVQSDQIPSTEQQQHQQQELSYFLESPLRQLPSSSPLSSPSLAAPSSAPRGKHAGYSGRPRLAPGAAAASGWESPHRSPRGGAVLDMPVTFQSRVKSSGYGAETKGKSLTTRLRSGSAPKTTTTTTAAGVSKKSISSYSTSSSSLTRLLLDQRLPDRPSPQPILQLAYSPDARYLVAVMGGAEGLTLPAFRLPLSKHCGDCTTFMGHKSRLTSASFSRDNSLLLATTDTGPVHLWRTSRGEGPALTISRCRPPSSEKTSTSASPPLATSAVVTGAGSKREGSEDKRSVYFEGNSPCYARFYFMDRFVALAYKSHVMLYSYVPGGGGTQQRGDLALHTPDSGGRLRQSFVWPAVSGMSRPPTTVTALDCINSVQSKYVLVTTADRRILLLDAAEGRVARDIASGHQRPIHSIATPAPSQHVTLSATSYQIFLTMATDGYLMLWDLRVPQSVYRYSNHVNRTEPLQAALSPDLSTIAVGSEDGSPRQIDLRNGTDVCRLPAHRDVCSAVAYNPLKPHLACGSYAGDLRFYAEPLI